MRKKVKHNPALLNEELRKFKSLLEYKFYREEEEPNVYGYDDDKNVILGSYLDEAEENTEDAADDIAKDLGIDDTNPEGGENADEPATDTETPEEPETDDEGGLDDLGFGDEEPIADDSNDVEIDVTSLVKGSEEAKAAAEQAASQSTQNAEMLLQKLNDLEAKIARMDAVSSKIEDLEKEIIKRNPTPVEKLEMRSLSSFPYSQKLTDYWADKEGAYDVMGKEDKPEEYVLTQDDVDTTYSEPEIKKSFGVSPDDYEEEDI